MELGVGLEIPGIGPLPVELGPAVAGQSNRAEIDELAQLLGQPVQVEGGRGGQLLRPAGRVEREEVGVTPKRLDDRALGAFVGFEAHQHGPAPGEPATLALGRQVARLDSPFPAHPFRTAATGRRHLQLAAGHLRPLADAERAGEHGGQPGKVDASAQLERLGGEPAEQVGSVALGQVQAAREGSVGRVGLDDEPIHVDAIALPGELARDVEAFQLHLIGLERGCRQHEMAGGRRALDEHPAGGRSAVPLAVEVGREPSGGSHLEPEPVEKRLEHRQRHALGLDRQLARGARPGIGRWRAGCGVGSGASGAALVHLELHGETARTARVGKGPGGLELDRLGRIGRLGQRKRERGDLPGLPGARVADRDLPVDDLDAEAHRVGQLFGGGEIRGQHVLQVAAVFAQDDVERGPLQPDLTQVGVIPEEREQGAVAADLADLEDRFALVVADLDPAKPRHGEPPERGGASRDRPLEVGGNRRDDPAQDRAVTDERRREPGEHHEHHQRADQPASSRSASALGDSLLPVGLALTCLVPLRTHSRALPTALRVSRHRTPPPGYRMGGVF